MKFKLKIPNSGINDAFITLQNENLSFGYLKESVASVLDENFTQKGTPFKLSLNGKDELTAEDNAILTADLGLVTGDIIRVLIENKYIEEQRAISKMSQDSQEAAERSRRSQTVNGKLINRFLREPMLCRESASEHIPELLRHEYESANVETRHDALVVAIHVLMLECGFTTTKLQWNGVKYPGGVYRLNYMHPMRETQCEITCASLGRNIAVHGTILDENEDPTFHTDFCVDTFCDSQIKSDPIYIFKNLPVLSQIFKDEIAHRILHALPYDVLQRRSFACCTLLDLPYECKMLLFGLLDFKSLLRVGVTCTNLQEVAGDPQLWKNLMFRVFPKRAHELEARAAEHDSKQQSDVQFCRVDWKKEYVSMERSRAACRNLLPPICALDHYRDRSYPPHRPDIFFGGGGIGIIGGYHDLHPQLPNPGYPRVEPRVPHQENPLIGPFRFRPHLPRPRSRGPIIPRFL